MLWNMQFEWSLYLKKHPPSPSCSDLYLANGDAQVSVELITIDAVVIGLVHDCSGTLIIQHSMGSKYLSDYKGCWNIEVYCII